MASVSPFVITFPSSTIAFTICILGLWLVYRRYLPRPLPGIPYNKDAANKILGDIQGISKHVADTGEIWSWFCSQAIKLNSPIVQVFMNPFSTPCIIISDFRESQDILMRRTKEFDRDSQFENVLSGIAPDHHIIMQSTHPEFKAHRKLVQDLMTPTFLNNVSAPRIYAAFTSLFELWTEKARLADGRPFSASEDFYKAALDAIWAVTFPFDLNNSVINAQLKLLAPLNNIESILSANIDDPATFPEAKASLEQESVLTLTDSVEIAVKSPLPKLTHWFLRWLPYMRKARAVKEEMITRELEKGKVRFTQGKKDDLVARCAMDDILYRELATAAKENRKPIYDSRMIYDELFGLLIAGHDTTSTTALWGLKLLSDHQEAQKKLCDVVRQGFPDAAAECRWPTAQEIIKAHIPYLDATQEEIIRKSTTASGVSRKSTVDTVILGHHIPKGTQFFLIGNGPDIVLPPVGGNIPEELRSESCRTAKGHVGSWDPKDCHLFKPERWLTMEDGKEVFDPTAGPLLTFGLGPRGCFGKRMAYLELKIALVLLVWNFNLKSAPQELSSYKATDRLTHQPNQCYLRLEKV